MWQKKPEEILRKAILGMLYRNNLRHGYIEPRLKIYTGPEHPHKVQLPAEVEPLPRHPRRRTKDTHFGLNLYSDPKASQRSFYDKSDE
mmetsp:Transcript_17983/g.27229  ORF Transcript_17983/g.27229 Transcript_17983/m.27229 type:complete len:88 (+) Transcript_17983:145-408(+)